MKMHIFYGFVLKYSDLDLRKFKTDSCEIMCYNNRFPKLVLSSNL